MVPGDLPPVDPLYGIQESVQDMGAAWAQADRQREEVSRQIGRVAVQETTLIVKP